jgi:hypothetical protein
MTIAKSFNELSQEAAVKFGGNYARMAEISYAAVKQIEQEAEVRIGKPEFHVKHGLTVGMAGKMVRGHFNDINISVEDLAKSLRGTSDEGATTLVRNALLTGLAELYQSNLATANLARNKPSM